MTTPWGPSTVPGRTATPFPLRELVCPQGVVIAAPDRLVTYHRGATSQGAFRSAAMGRDRPKAPPNPTDQAPTHEALTLIGSAAPLPIAAMTGRVGMPDHGNDVIGMN